MIRDVLICLSNVAMAAIVGLTYKDCPPVAIGMFAYLVFQQLDDIRG